jgi:hypothetical protein
MLSTIKDIRGSIWSFFTGSLHYYFFFTHATILVTLYCKRNIFSTARQFTSQKAITQKTSQFPSKQNSHSVTCTDDMLVRMVCDVLILLYKISITSMLNCLTLMGMDSFQNTSSPQSSNNEWLVYSKELWWMHITLRITGVLDCPHCPVYLTMDEIKDLVSLTDSELNEWLVTGKGEEGPLNFSASSKINSVVYQEI